MSAWIQVQNASLESPSLLSLSQLYLEYGGSLEMPIHEAYYMMLRKYMQSCSEQAHHYAIQKPPKRSIYVIFGVVNSHICK